MLKPTIELAEEIVQIAEMASAEILAVYEEAFDVESKADESPLTMADKRAHTCIVGELTKRYPHIPII